DLRARPTQRLGEGRTSHIAGVATAHGGGAGDKRDFLPLHTGIGQRGAGGVHAIFDEVATPFSPGVHARANDCDFVAHFAPPAGRHFQVRRSPSCAGIVSSASSISMPISRPSISLPFTTCPSTTICSFASSTAAMA